jgi:hypothetical protein
MSSRRTFIVIVVLVALAVATYCTISIMRDHVTNEMQAEKALKVLRPRVQQFADASGYIPNTLDDLQERQITNALRQQIERAGFDLIWLRRDDHYGVLIARIRSTTEVSKAYLAFVVVPESKARSTQ